MWAYQRRRKVKKHSPRIKNPTKTRVPHGCQGRIKKCKSNDLGLGGWN